jgi:hypothetical protein
MAQGVAAITHALHLIVRVRATTSASLSSTAEQSKLTIACDKHTFNFTRREQYVFLVVAVSKAINAIQLFNATACITSLSGASRRSTTVCDSSRGSSCATDHNMLHYHKCLQDEAFGRQIPFAFLERMSDEFIAGFASKGKTAAPHSMDRSFGAKLKQHMVRMKYSMRFSLQHQHAIRCSAQCSHPSTCAACLVIIAMAACC